MTRIIPDYGRLGGYRGVQTLLAWCCEIGGIAYESVSHLAQNAIDKNFLVVID